MLRRAAWIHLRAVAWPRDPRTGSVRRPPSFVRRVLHPVVVGDDRARDLTAEFEAAYETTPPWDIGRPQPPFEALARSGAWVGPLLDVGCGTGEHVLLASDVGLDATGVDIAPTAVRLAEAKRDERGTTARFFVHDALDLAALGARYTTVIDCGLFHVFDDDDRPRFVRSLADATAEGGRYFMLCFSELEPGGWGPRRVTQDELRASFASGWRVDAIDPSTIDVTVRPEPAKAWLLAATRVAS